MKTVYADLLREIMRMPGVRGAIVVAVRDGLVVDGRVHVGIRSDAVAALAASLFQRALRSTETGREERRFVELEADRGRIMMAGEGELALMAILEPRANAGQARLAIQRAATALAGGGG
ncbi:MAG: roadblock/LC7 domain-containing protein [Gemmatimonadota bacterium]|nr:MAG: roadblock/LC7 domain-containing protein [Gemmatimonadota bacterium]